ncbi:hypothetical protein LMORI2_09100 [Limnohabitans sp. MORI2]|nr:hypothetical protein LMORI2_09100 [Limnohabitans sp. MORI2]
MDTLTFLKLILPEDGYKFVGLSRAGSSGIAHKAYESLELMADAIAFYDKQTNLTVYHACAAYKEASYEAVVNGETKRKYRGQPNLLKAKSLWCDIDCGEKKAAEGKGYATKGDAVKAIGRFCAEKGLPDPMIVDSGGGIHCYWPLTKTVGPRKWNLMATMLKAAFKEAGLLVDPTRTADMSSVLRPVGSHNRKPGREVREVKTKSVPTFVVPEQLFKTLSEITQSVELPHNNKYAEHVALNDDLTAHLATLVEASVDFELVKAGCNVVAWASDPSNQNNVEEPLWRGLLGIVKFCDEASQLAHQVSAHHSKYDSDETLQKLEGWTTGPTTCAYFASYKPDLCRACKHIEAVAA